jgi:hypothetical protein
MTWHTQIDDRVLEGSEAALYLSALQHAVEYLEEMADLEEEVDILTCDRIFDSASFDQKVVLLHTCLSALLDPNVPIPALTNVLEAAAYFPFVFLRRQIGEEIENETFESEHPDDFEQDEDARYYYRRMLWQIFEEYIRPLWDSATEEYGEDEEEKAFHDRSTNFDLWASIIEDMMERIFWDRDWMVSSLAPQLLDGIEEEFSNLTDVTEEYLINRLPNVTPYEVEAALAAIYNWPPPAVEDIPLN